MKNSSKFLVVIGCLFILVAVILRGMGFLNPAAHSIVNPMSLLILANTSFILAILLKK